MESGHSESSSLLRGGLQLGNIAGINSDNWKIVATQGLFGLTYGLLALFFPGITLAIFTYMFASFAVVSGARSIYCGLSARDDPQTSSVWIWGVVEGLLCFVAGLWGLVWPGMTAVFMLYIVAAWAMFAGISEVLMGCSYREEIRWGNVVNGVILVVLGAFLYSQSPAEGILALIWAVGVQGVLGGCFLLFSALWFRRRYAEPTLSQILLQADEERPPLPS